METTIVYIYIYYIYIYIYMPRVTLGAILGFAEGAEEAMVFVWGLGFGV